MRRNERVRRAGSASVEVLVMLPVFVTLFAGAYYVHDVANGRLVANARARGCALQFAMAGCPRDGGALSLCGDQARPLQGDALRTDLSAEDTSALEAVADIPLLGSLIETLFGEAAAAEARIQVPGLLGADPEVHVGDMHLVCNVAPRSWDGIGDMLCDLADSTIPDVEVPGC